MRYLTQLKPAGTNSYRLSASQLFDFGGNAQNNSKGTMDIFEAPEGWSFAQRDQSGAESLAVAYSCRPGRYRNLFIHGVKPHTYVALHLFLDQFKGNHPRQRYWLQDPKVLRTFEEWKHISDVIKNSEHAYDIGKKTGHACCDDKTEVLTPIGWAPISTKPSKILVSSLMGAAHFEEVIWNEYTHNGAMYHFSGEEIDQCVTLNHRIPYENNGKRKVKDASYLATCVSGTRNIPVTGYAEGLQSYETGIIQLMAAIQADGSYSHNKVRFHFKKVRKIQRLETLCMQFGIRIKWTRTGDSYKCSLDRNGPIADACDLLTDDKKFSWALSSLNVDNAQTLIDEVVFWDGYTDSGPRNYKSYVTEYKQNAEIIYTVARLCGTGSTKRFNDGVWAVSFNNRQCSVAQDATPVYYSGQVYCPTTTLGYFYTRRNDKISITGNSNYKMGPNTFREFTLKESEGALILDMAQAQFYLGTYKELFPEIVEWQNEIEARVRRDRRLVNLLGFPRRFERLFTDSYIREIISWIPQSTVGCITHNAVEHTCAHIRKEKLPWRLVSNKHDSYALLVPDNHLPEVREVMKRHINITLRGVDSEFTMASDFQVGKNLKKFSKTNPQGMLEQ